MDSMPVGKMPHYSAQVRCECVCYYSLVDYTWGRTVYLYSLTSLMAFISLPDRLDELAVLSNKLTAVIFYINLFNIYSVFLLSV